MNEKSHSMVCLNGNMIPREQASISIEDRGFRFGDGVFETMRTYDGMIYLWEYHERRLEEGLKAIKIEYDIKQLLHIIPELLETNQAFNAIVRLQITRGAGSRGYQPYPKIEGTSPTLVIETLPLPELKKQADKYKLFLSSYTKPSPSALPVKYKLMQGLNSTLASIEAKEQGCQEALILNAEKVVCEASAANIFWCKGKTLYTPSLESGCLAGTLRERVIEISPYHVKASRFRLKALLRADAVMLTNSVFELIPVHGIEGYTTHWSASEKLVKIYRMHLEKDMQQARESRKNLAIPPQAS